MCLVLTIGAHHGDTIRDVRNTLAWLTLLLAAWGPTGHAADESPRDQNSAPAAAQARRTSKSAGRFMDILFSLSER